MMHRAQKAMATRLEDPALAGLECLRLIHGECGPFACDRFGPTLAFYWYRSTQPGKEDWQTFEQLTKFAGAETFVLYPRFARKTTSSWTRPDISWIAREHDTCYELRGNHGTSPGLFLDQRQQRAWVLQESHNKRVLNLFCYTSGFSCVAARGGAKEVVSVDTSASALAWSKENVAHNGDTAATTMRFWKDDVRAVLARLQRKGHHFDLVVCDPPSFSHGKGNAFSLQQQLATLMEDSFAVVTPKGALLFSCNLESLSHQHFRSLCAQLTPQYELFGPTHDFTSKKPYHLKSALLVKSE